MSKNPKSDWSINPDHTWAINPKHTWAINPPHTWAINPIHTWAINPVHTWAISPVHTWAINPMHTWAINPKHTPSLKPSSVGFKGLLVKDKDTDVALYYSVDCHVKENVLIIFDYTDNPVFFAVGRQSGYSIFDFKTQAYIGYWASNGKGGYNWFNLNDDWLYYVI